MMARGDDRRVRDGVMMLVKMFVMRRDGLNWIRLRLMVRLWV